MCGIAGTYNPNIQDPLLRSSVLASMAHRGPDAQAFAQLGALCLFHSRLSIIDISERANQPITDHSGRYVLVFNGEIYNYQQLKAGLAYPWQTSSDSEVLLALLIAKGAAALPMLEGMFAFAFYDTQEQKLLLARDRFGKKPLYMHTGAEGLSFASEVRTLLVLHPELAKVSKQEISNWLHWQTIPGQQTLLNGITQLSPGCSVEVRAGKVGEELPFTTWQTDYVLQEQTEASALSTLQALGKGAVQKRLVSDVPFACFLSGGVDSSIITALAAQELGSALHTFTVSFDEQQFSEHLIAAEVAKHYGTKHHEIRLTPSDFLSEIESGLAATDHPSGDGLNTYVVAKHTRAAGFKMALSGIGGDEWFLGYGYFQALDTWKNRQWLRHAAAFSSLLPFPYRKGIEITQQLHLGAAAYAAQRIVIDSHSIQAWLGLPAPNSGPTAAIWPDTMSARSVEEWRYYTQPVLLRDSDQYSMAVGLELRAPFMDQDLVNFALQLPDALKSGDKAKHLLIEAFKHLLPERVYNRQKQGFTLPWELWMRQELSTFCSERIASFAQRIDLPQLNKDWSAFLSGKSKVAWSRWWSMVALEDYLERNNLEIIQ